MKSDKFLNLLIYLLILSIPLYILRFSVGPIPTTFFEVFLYFVFVFFLFRKQILFNICQSRFYLPLLFVLVAFFASLIDPQTIRGLGLWKAYFFDAFLFYLIIYGYLKGRKNIRRSIFSSIDLMTVLVSAIGIAIFVFYQRTPDGRLYDLDMISPNYMAMLLSPLFVFSLLRIKKEKTLPIFASLLSISALLLTQSRGAILAIGLALFYYLIVSLKGRSKYLASASLVIFFLLMAFIYQPQWSDNGRRATSSNVRYHIWETSLEIIKINPIFGVGLGNYQDYFSNLTQGRVNYPEFISPQALTAHNLFLHLFITIGLFGLAIFLILLINTRFWKVNPYISAPFVAILSYGLIDTPFFRNDLAIIFWLFLGLIYFNKK